MSTPVNGKTLSGTIFRTVLAFSLAIVLVILGVAATTFFVLFEHQAEENLAHEAEEAAVQLQAADDPAAVARAQLEGSVRFTYIGADGTVIADTEADASALDNHADRPEVQDAQATGVAVVVGTVPTSAAGGLS